MSPFDMPKMPPRCKMIGVRATTEQAAELEALATDHGLTVSELVRKALDAWIVANPPRPRNCTIHRE